MEEIALIEQYVLKELHIKGGQAFELIEKVTKYDDIRQEFAKWLVLRVWAFDQPIIIEGYTAAKIHELAPDLSGIGVYNFLTDLRDYPEEAKKIIADGFPMY